MTKQKIITTTPNQHILWNMVYLNTIPIRNLSHKTEKYVWGAIVLLPWTIAPHPPILFISFLFFIFLFENMRNKYA